MFQETIEYLQGLVNDDSLPSLSKSEIDAVERRQERHLRYKYKKKIK